MTNLCALWLPILLAAVAVFVVSSIIHMATPWHRDDYQAAPKEAELMDAVRPFALPPGDYMVPKAGDMAQMKTPEFQDKLKKGPVLMMTVFPSGMFEMTKPLILWFIYSVVVAVFAGYVACSTLPAGAPYLKVFQVTGTVAFAGYALGLWQLAIWYRRPLGTTIRSTIDGLIYALLTAGMFGWLWPKM